MKFGNFPLNEILGGTLAHSVRLPGGLLKKGHILTEEDLKTLANNNITEVMVALLDPGDMPENCAAGKIADHIAGDQVTCATAFTGRVNLYAAAGGLVTIDEAAVTELNHRDEAITLATLPQNAIVHQGQLVATVKIIPLALPGEAVDRLTAEITPGLITLHPFQPKVAMMIQTELASTSEKLFEKAHRVMSHRLGIYGATLMVEERCRHEEGALADLLMSITAGNQDMILILGASAITDRRDVIPAAIQRAGGEVIHYGMPVDPGNLMLLAKIQDTWVLGLPGCSRSPKLNGIDLILSRIAAGMDVTSHDVMSMGVGGLLSEYPGRPQPRDFRHNAPQEKKTRTKAITALVLAAGQSKRMGQKNKLLLPYHQGTVLSHVLDQVTGAGIEEIFVVTGHQHDEVARDIGPHKVTFLYNDLYDEGMSTSVKLGISSLPKESDAVLIILGDMPNISASILRQLMAAYDPAQGRLIIIPTHNGKRGNPLLWDRSLFSEFDRLDGDMGAKILLADYPEYIHEVDVGSEAIFLDIDTYEAYERLSET
ncbi:MAG: 4-diphosphocytidyl-2C-methyl-D-erythritol kinase [Alphaproteobacteria bacterium]|nr:MAG: 4-diphosphocytidyl-2C-methyl-D-erythritol kinase [Alphaproteobacteria bacterium]